MASETACTKLGHESKDQESFERTMFGAQKYVVFSSDRRMVDAFEDLVMARCIAKASRGYVRDLSGRIYAAAR